MKRHLLICCAFIIFFVIVIVTVQFVRQPIAKVGDDTVNMYEFISYALENEQYILEKVADEKAFQKLIEETGVTVTEAEVSREMDCIDSLTDISYETCKKSILTQKAIEKYASEITVTAETAREYYEKNKWRYDVVPDYEKVKIDMQMDMGVAKYEERLCQIRQEYTVSYLE